MLEKSPVYRSVEYIHSLQYNYLPFFVEINCGCPQIFCGLGCYRQVGYCCKCVQCLTYEEMLLCTCWFFLLKCGHKTQSRGLLTPKAIGWDGTDVGELVDFAGVRLAWHERHIVLLDPSAVIFDRYLVEPMVIQTDFNTSRPGVHGILDKFPVGQAV